MEKIENPIEVLSSVRIPPSQAQVTKVKIGDDIVYIRENVADGANVLELCAAEEVWGKVAAVVVVEDSLKREVRRNPDFTADWAEAMLAPAGGRR